LSGSLKAETVVWGNSVFDSALKGTSER